MSFDLSAYEISVSNVVRNAPPARLYEEALRYENASIASTGALVALSGEKTGRSPADKRIVTRPSYAEEVWWGDVNIKLDPTAFMINRERAVDYLNTRSRLYVLDGYAGWDPKHQLKVRIVCARAYHALFMHNMLIRPTPEQLADFGEPDYVIFNAGKFSANRYTTGMTSKTSVDLDLERREMVILGTEYAGEMKKGVFTVMHYLMPKRDVLSMHCSANEGDGGNVCLFFGLSGTGKTTLSADASRRLIGDDEHCWTDEGVFNIEGGCYAKMIDLSAKQEPEIWNAIRYGAVLENVVFDPATRGGLLGHLADPKHTRIVPDRAHRQRQDPVFGRSPIKRRVPHVRRVWCAAAGLQALRRAGDVPLHQRIHRQGGGDRDGRDRAAGDLQRLFRCALPGAPPCPLRRAPRGEAGGAWRTNMVGEHGLERRRVRRG